MAVTVKEAACPTVTVLFAGCRVITGSAGLTVRTAVFELPIYPAVMFTTVDTDTALAVTVKVALFCPNFTVTLLGTVATDGALLVSDTDMPLRGAVPSKTTVPMELPPPVTLVGLRDIEDMLVAALADSATNARIAINAAKTAITDKDLLCLHIFPFPLLSQAKLWSSPILFYLSKRQTPISG